MKKSGKQLVDYSQLCKAIRTNMRKDLRDYNDKKIKETIENLLTSVNKSLYCMYKDL